MYKYICLHMYINVRGVSGLIGDYDFEFSSSVVLALRPARPAQPPLGIEPRTLSLQD